MYPCEYKVPIDPKTGLPAPLDGYPGVQNSTCTYCDEVCPHATVNADIGFFDGFDDTAVGWTYGIILTLTILWQIYLCMCRKGKIDRDYNDMMSKNTNFDIAGESKNINVTYSSGEVNQYR